MVIHHDRRNGKNRVQELQANEGETLSQWAAPEKRGKFVTRGELLVIMDLQYKFQKAHTLWGRLTMYLDNGFFRFGRKSLRSPAPAKQEAPNV